MQSNSLCGWYFLLLDISSSRSQSSKQGFPTCPCVLNLCFKCFKHQETLIRLRSQVPSSVTYIDHLPSHIDICRLHCIT
ncbi:hypothetical protein BDQ17DRAFT_274432 [Cyathus striatus]|nr:hypothetical protein BDQ17DRAFT_274432 [Cyathus striatus]